VQPAIIRDPADTEAQLAKVAGAKYSYRQLDNYTDLIQRTLQGVPETSTITRAGVLQEQIYLNYSQQRLAQYGYDLPTERRPERAEHHAAGRLA